MPLRVLDFGVARRLGCAPMGTRSAIAGIPVYLISLRDCETRRRNMTARLGTRAIAFAELPWLPKSFSQQVEFWPNFGL